MVVLAGVVRAMALLGIGAGFFLLLFAGPLGTALSIPSLTGCLVVALAIALMILLAGTLLDRRLAAELDRFVAGRSSGFAHVARPFRECDHRFVDRPKDELPT